MNFDIMARVLQREHRTRKSRFIVLEMLLYQLFASPKQYFFKVLRIHLQAPASKWDRKFWEEFWA